MDYREFVNAAVEEKRDEIVNVSDRIFDFAEIGFHEFKTAKLYEEVLTREGFQVEMGLAGMPTAFKAQYGQGKPVVGFLAEYDALPELSQKGGCTARVRAEGENPDGHGCGHNLLGGRNAGGGAGGEGLPGKESGEGHGGALWMPQRGEGQREDHHGQGRDL